MRCILVNHTHINEIQTITQIFFPNERFIRSDTLDKTGYSLVSILRPDGVECIGEVYHNGIPLAVHTVSATDVPVPRALMLALFHALKRSVDAYAPWGSLTGIRPSKLARQWLEEGKTDKRIVTDFVNIYQCHENKACLALEVAAAENRLNKRIEQMAAAYSFDNKIDAPACLSLDNISLPYANSHPVKPLGLYISIPFCPSRCLYCSFNNHDKPAKKETQEKYLDALLAECVQTAASARALGGAFTEIYIGGGTPTVLNERLLERLLTGVTERFSTLTVPGAEYTVEAGRPDSLTFEKLRIMKDHSVTRLAVNPQTLNDNTLRLIGRVHTVRDFYNAFEMARSAGFNHINTDVIAGLPGEDVHAMRRTMDGLTALAPENITVHTLAVKRASRLNEYSAEYAVPGPAETEAMLDIAAELCRKSGLLPYYLYRQKNSLHSASAVSLFENVGYSKPGYECLYNIGMMAETQTILGAGAGAVTKYVEGSRIERKFNVKNPSIYIQRVNG